MQSEIKLILKPWVVSFKEALDIEDFNSRGYITIDQFKNAIRQLELNFSKNHIDYMIYEMYKYSKNSHKLNYIKIFDALGLKVDEETPARLDNKQDEEDEDDYEGDFNIEDNEVKKKNINTKATTQREEVKETLNDVHQNDTELEFGETNTNKNDIKLKKGSSNEDSDIQGDAFQSKTDELNEASVNVNNIAETQNMETGGILDTQHNFDTERQKIGTEQTNTENNIEGENDDDYINDEEMIRIAESCLIRISDELKKKNITIQELFKENIMVESIGDQDIELLAPIHFIEGLKTLGIDNFSELEIAWLVNLLTRPELDDLILVEELNMIKDHSKIRESVSEMLDKSGQSPFRERNEDNTEREGTTSNERNKRRGLNFSKIGDRSVWVIFLLTEYLLRNNMSLFTLYDGKIYDQLVKTKTKESVVEIISSKDFFGIIQSGIVSEAYLNTIDDTKQLVEEGDSYQTVQEDLQNLLWLDQNYKDLLLIKKVTKFIDELTMREDLREQALRVLPDDIDFGEIDENEANAYEDANQQPEPFYNAKHNFMKEPMSGKGRNNLKNPYPGGGERLNTIEEEEKQFDTTSNIYKTNERKNKESSGVLTYSKHKEQNKSKGVLSEANK